jgi:hypothetical protein
VPDLKSFTITPAGTGNVSVPKFTLSGQVVDSTTGALIRDFTGVNAVAFPAVLSTLTATDQLEMVQLIVLWLLQKKGIM